MVEDPKPQEFIEYAKSNGLDLSLTERGDFADHRTAFTYMGWKIDFLRKKVLDDGLIAFIGDVLRENLKKLPKHWSESSTLELVCSDKYVILSEAIYIYKRSKGMK